jgi:putative ABC transport system permease protein
MNGLVQECRTAFRTVLREPSVSILIVVMLALGIGANAAMFGMIDRLLIRPFPFADIDRLVMVSETSPTRAFGRESVSPANLLDWKAQTDVVERLSGFAWWDVNLVGRDEPERVQGFFVSADFFPALGVAPMLGRSFTGEAEVYGRHRQVVLGHGLWMRRFGGDPGVVGDRILLDAEPFEIVGVAPAGFDFPMGSELWAPLAFEAPVETLRGSRNLSVIGRLAPGRTLEDANAEMRVVAARLAEAYPDTNRQRGAEVRSLLIGMRDAGAPSILALCQAGAGLLLLIACANVANLLIARSTTRQRELAVRVAIGASRGRLVRHLLVEALLLAMAAVPVSLVVASASLHVLRTSMPARIVRFVPGWQEMGLDSRLVTFSVAVAVGATFIFGLLSAIQALRPQLSETLKEGGRSATAGRARQRLRRGLVVAQIALVLPLLVASALAVSGTARFLNGPQGYDPDNLLVARLVLPDARYPDAESHRRFTAALLDRIREYPEVASAAAANVLPSSGSNWSTWIEIEGRPPVDPITRPTVDYRSVSPSYFDAMQIPILRGRALGSADREDTMAVVVVSQSLADRYWPGEDPIGRRLQSSRSGDQWLTVVGIAGDVIHEWFGRRHHPTMYRPQAQAPTSTVALAVRTNRNPAELVTSLRGAVSAVDPGQPVFDLMTMRTQLSERTVGLQYVSTIMAVLGGMALLLATVGVYGLMSWFVAERRHEIGVRMALGARPRDVRRLTVGHALRMTSLGVVVGLALAVALERLMESALFGVVSVEAWMFGAFAVVLIATGLMAGYLPARRAALLDPIAALRGD